MFLPRAHLSAIVRLCARIVCASVCCVRAGPHLSLRAVSIISVDSAGAGLAGRTLGALLSSESSRISTIAVATQAPLKRSERHLNPPASEERSDLCLCSTRARRHCRNDAAYVGLRIDVSPRRHFCGSARQSRRNTLATGTSTTATTFTRATAAARIPTAGPRLLRLLCLLRLRSRPERSRPERRQFPATPSSSTGAAQTRSRLRLPGARPVATAPAPAVCREPRAHRAARRVARPVGAEREPPAGPRQCPRVPPRALHCRRQRDDRPHATGDALRGRRHPRHSRERYTRTLL